MKTILVPVDFSDVSNKVVETAATLAAAFESKVILVHVAEPTPEFVGYDPGPLVVQVTVAGDPRADRLRVQAFKEKFSAPDTLALYVEGSPPDEILNLAREHGATLIVIGSHGHGALYHLLAGSVTTAILKEAACPVLVVPGDRSLRGVA